MALIFAMLQLTHVTTPPPPTVLGKTLTYLKPCESLDLCLCKYEYISFNKSLSQNLEDFHEKVCKRKIADVLT